MARIRWTRQGRADLRGIREWIAKDSPLFADVFVDRLLNSVERLREFPRSGRVVPEYNADTIREVIVGAYRIVYRLDDERGVEVLTVFHSTWSLALKGIRADPRE
jgi:toxin ParE1/3/4